MEDPTTALWQEEKSTVLDWLRSRLEQRPTILVGQRRIPDVAKSHRHKVLTDRPIVLKKAPDGFRDWSRLGELVKGRPAALTLARALVPWLPARDFNDLVARAKDENIRPPEVLHRLREAFRLSVDFAPTGHDLADSDARAAFRRRMRRQLHLGRAQRAAKAHVPLTPTMNSAGSGLN
ncbi:hypothetical protein sce2104 [Sorangium cellulosum So ce56]|uniref:Uncharacterized protein n=1 Tax=Sorangium cellulosum (strain So ce56) TaxID=448385 RepID=A9FVD2_SORC5|nr:hypothetical protein [Sorangium cellulosum]CAN92263.1 hypothetical protein sce2104 [Sorangium cellulosum So ce56]